MPPRRAADTVPAAPGPCPPSQRVLLILWPAFVMAGVLEMLVFAVVDPEHLQRFDGAPLHWAREAVYSVTFLIFWGVIAAASVVTRWLERPVRHPLAD